MQPIRDPIIIAAFVSLLAVPLAGAAQEGDEWSEFEGLSGATAKNGTLIVKVQGLESDEGKLRFVMFDSEENFLKNAYRDAIIEIADGQGTWTVKDLPHGVYAVLVHHDIDGSGVMERHWYGKPKEPTGTSNDPPARMGPPKYDKAKFSVESPEMTMSITVR